MTYVINPYLGCGHGCRYCYATFMRQYSKSHAGAAWGDFVEAKLNIGAVLRDELRRKRKTATALLSSVCDPYQPAERTYRLSRACIEWLREFGWGIHILTRSPLVLRDLDLLSTSLDVVVGFSIPTDNERVRRVLEPGSPSIRSRVAALEKVHAAGVRTWAFIAPMLPMNAAKLHSMVSPHVDYIMLDALNYKRRVSRIFKDHGWEHALSTMYARNTRDELLRLFGEQAAV